MKKSLIFISLILLLTGCSTNVTYDFSKDKIDSNIEILFNNVNVDEILNNPSMEDGQITNYEKAVEDYVESTAIYAAKGKTYNKDSFSSDNGNYKLSYSYTFSYEDFRDNYYFNNCLEYYTYTEDNNNYYYSLSGKNNCSYENVKLNIKGNILSSNSGDIENGIHSWNILKNENDIYFVISKKDINNKSGISKWKIIGGIILLLLILVSAFIIKKTN